MSLEAVLRAHSLPSISLGVFFSLISPSLLLLVFLFPALLLVLQLSHAECLLLPGRPQAVEWVVTKVGGGKSGLS